MTSESACIELIANSLFRNINLQKAQTRDLLVCPICRAGLEALQLQKDDKGNQTIWWVCKNTIEQKCSFPGEIPPEVFWVQRTKEECESGYIPPPNKEKLPRETWHLYPTIFPNLPVLPPHPETGESSLLVQEATFDTRDASLASDISSIDGRSSSSHDTSVIPIERNPSDAMVGGSNSYTTNESNASTVNQRENLVPTNTTATARKRPADGSFIQATPEKRHFLQQLHEQLKNGGLDEEELLKLSEKIKEMERKEEPLSESDLLHLGEFIRQDDYTDSIRQRIPDLSAADVTRIIKQKPTTEKFGILNGARLQGAKTATEFLKLLGLSGAPVTTGNKWRTETREQVDNVLRKAAKETKKSMDRMTQKRRIAEVTPNSLRAVIFPSSTKQPDAERQRQLEKECELKTKALIQSKLKQRQEAEKHALLAEKHRLEELQRLRLQQTIQEPSSELPVHTSYSEPFPSSTARDRHYSLQSYDGFNHDYPVPSADFDDLFDNLDSYEIDLR